MSTPPTPESASSSPSTVALFDLLGRRWALRILWELREAPLSFQTLQTRCDSMSTSVLSQRLTELRGAGLVEKDDAGPYRLTHGGVALLERLSWVDEWTSQWGKLIGGALEGHRAPVRGPTAPGTPRAGNPRRRDE